MTTCIICRFDTELDDVAVAGGEGRCVCLRCFARETDSVRPMSKALRRAVISALAELETA